jgi:hypothetical protein
MPASGVSNELHPPMQACIPPWWKWNIFDSHTINYHRGFLKVYLRGIVTQCIEQFNTLSLWHHLYNSSPHQLDSTLFNDIIVRYSNPLMHTSKPSKQISSFRSTIHTQHQHYPLATTSTRTNTLDSLVAPNNIFSSFNKTRIAHRTTLILSPLPARLHFFYELIPMITNHHWLTLTTSLLVAELLKKQTMIFQWLDVYWWKSWERLSVYNYTLIRTCKVL